MAQILPIPSSASQQLIEPAYNQSPSWGPPGLRDPEEGISAAAFLGLLRRHWLLMFVIVALSIAASYGITRITTPLYQASTTLYFADRQGSIPALDLLNQIENGNNEVATEMEVMQSRALAQEVVDSLGLQAVVTLPKGSVTSKFLRVLRADPNAPDAHYEFRRRGPTSFTVTNSDSSRTIGVIDTAQEFTLGGATVELINPTELPASFVVHVRPRTTAVDGLLLATKVVRPNPVASVVQIAYTSHDRIETKRVPDLLANTYLAWRSALRKSGDRSTVEFLRRQIDTIATQLYGAEEALRSFRQTNQVVDLPTQAEAEVQRLAALEAQRADINVQRASLTRLMADVKSAPSNPQLGSPYRRLMAFPALMTNSNPALPLLQTLTTLEGRRTELLVRRTRADPEVQSLSQAIADVESQIAGVVDTYVKGLDEQANAISNSLSQFHLRVDQVPRKEVEYARLDRTVSGLTQIYTMLQTRLREAQIAEAVDDGAVRVVDPAIIPIQPVSPRLGLNLLLGSLIGLLLAFSSALLKERLDHSIHTKEEVESIASAPVLALIPHIGEVDRSRYLKQLARLRRVTGRSSGGVVEARDDSKLLLRDPQSIASEAFRKLRTNINFARPDSPPRVLVFTSPAAGDGKTTSVMNLAIALVQQGKKIIVIDGDMRRGGLHKMLGGRRSPGLSDILAGHGDVTSSVQSLALESFGSVDLLATGFVPPNPAELLGSPRFRALLDGLRVRYDVILIDSPPVNIVTDAAIIGREVDGAILVARASKTMRGELAHAAMQLRQVQVPVTGLILNDFDAKRDASYSSAYYYGYSYEYRPASES